MVFSLPLSQVIDWVLPDRSFIVITLSLCSLVFVAYSAIYLTNCVNNFSVVPGWNQRFLGITQYCGGLMCLAQGHNVTQCNNCKNNFLERATTAVKTHRVIDGFHFHFK